MEGLGEETDKGGENDSSRKENCTVGLKRLTHRPAEVAGPARLTPPYQHWWGLQNLMGV